MRSSPDRSASIAGHRLSASDPAAPWLSIVVPVLDEASAVPAALAALGPLRAGGVEVIVVDGGSRDGTAEAARDGADRVLAASRGRARQMNAGAAAARGAVLLFLHVDTVLPAGATEAIAAALRPGARSGGARLWGRFDVVIAGRPRMLRVVAALMNARSRWTGLATGDQAIFVDRTVFERIGGFPDQPLMEDLELSQRLRRQHGRPACLRLRVVTSGRRWETRGTWRTIVLMWRLRFLYACGVAPERLARSYR